MAYGHLDTVCAARRKRNEDSFNRRLLRYCGNGEFGVVVPPGRALLALLVQSRTDSS